MFESTLIVQEDLGFESYVCQLCVVVLLLIFNNMYEHGIGNVSLYWLECITKLEFGWIGCAFDLIIDGLLVQTWLGKKLELYFF